MSLHSSLYVFMVLFLLSFTCWNAPVYEKHFSIPNHQWPFDKAYVFGWDNKKDKQQYRLFIHFEINKEYLYKNIFFRFIKKSPSLLIDTSIIDISLAYPDGKWKGMGRGKSISFFYLFTDALTNIEQGAYQFSLQPFIREDTLKHVSSIGIRIDKVKMQ